MFRCTLVSECTIRAACAPLRPIPNTRECAFISCLLSVLTYLLSRTYKEKVSALTDTGGVCVCVILCSFSAFYAEDIRYLERAHRRVGYLRICTLLPGPSGCLPRSATEINVYNVFIYVMPTLGSQRTSPYNTQETLNRDINMATNIHHESICICVEKFFPNGDDCREYFSYV